MDEAAIEEAGFAPIKPELDAIAAVTNRQQLIDLFARNHGGLLLKPIIVGVDFDRNQVGKTIVSIETSGLSLGARDFYLEPAYAPVRRRSAPTSPGCSRSPASTTPRRGRGACRTWRPRSRRSAGRHRQARRQKEEQRDERGRAREAAPGIDWPRYLAAAGVGAPRK